VARLVDDDDFAVRLLLCEYQVNVSADTVLATYLQATTLSRGRLLTHPALRGADLVHFADSDDPSARCLVRRDPTAAAALIEGLSHDPHPAVRASTASDARLSLGRLLELFDDPSTTEAAASNPRLPVSVMELILEEAADLAHEQIEGTPRVYLGRWQPDQLQEDE
jgi:hypothetical protein